MYLKQFLKSIRVTYEVYKFYNVGHVIERGRRSFYGTLRFSLRNQAKNNFRTSILINRTHHPKMDSSG